MDARPVTRWHLSLGAALLLLRTVAPGGAVAQTVVQLPSSHPGEICGIKLEKVVELGDEEGEGYIDLTGRVAVVEAGILVANFGAAHEIRLYSNDGNYLQTIGRRGEGPGEFSAISDIRTSSDGRVHVVDRGLGRITILDRRLSLEGIVNLPARPIERGVLPLEDGGYVLNATISTADLIGFPLHRITSEGELVLTYDDTSPEVRPDRPLGQMRRVAASGTSGFWSASSSESDNRSYRIVRYRMDGPRTHEFSVPAPWMDVRTGAQLGGGAPPRGLMDVQQVDSGQIWVISRTAGSSWEEALVRRAMPGHGMTWAVSEYHKYWDTVIDLIDPEQHALLARAVWDGYMLRFLSPELALSYDDSTPTPTLSIWRVTPSGSPTLTCEEDS